MFVPLHILLPLACKESTHPSSSVRPTGRYLHSPKSLLSISLYQRSQHLCNFPNCSDRFTSLMSCHHVPEWYIQALSSHQDKSELVTIIMDNNINYPEARFKHSWWINLTKQKHNYVYQFVTWHRSAQLAALPQKSIHHTPSIRCGCALNLWWTQINDDDRKKKKTQQGLYGSSWGIASGPW